MAEPAADEISYRVASELGPTRFACTSLAPLSGGTANFIFRGKLQKPLDDGTAEIVVKHGEGFVAQSPALKLSTSRCVGPNSLAFFTGGSKQLTGSEIRASRWIVFRRYTSWLQ